jgi:hypothetical protein
MNTDNNLKTNGSTVHYLRSHFYFILLYTLSTQSSSSHSERAIEMSIHLSVAFG